MEVVTPLRPTEDLNSFFDYLYGDSEGYVYSPMKSAEGEFTQRFFQWPKERHKLVEWVLSVTTTADVYVAPAIFDAPRATKDHFKQSRVLWTEFDGNLPKDFGNTPNPTYRVQSSDPQHQHCYWLIEYPITDANEIEAYNRTLAYTLNADASSWDCNQVLRPPGTVNHKRNTQVSIAYSDATEYPIGLFKPTYPDIEVGEINPDVIPDVTDIVFKYPFPDEFAALFRTKDFPVGDRSTALMRLGYYSAELGMSDVEIFSLLRNADDRWGKFKGRTDRDKRLIDLISRVRQKYPATEFQTDLIPVFGFQSFLEHEVQVEWVIPGLLQEQGYMLLTGPSGVGKTQFTLRWAMNLALGRGWLGMEVPQPRKILVFSLEMGHADLKYFVSQMARDFSPDSHSLLEENLIIVPMGEALYLDREDGRAQFLAIVEAIKPDGIVIDSVGSTTAGALTDETTVKSIMDFNDRLRRQQGCFTWWIHHQRKAQSENKKPNKLSDVYGNQYLVNRATSVYCLWPNHGKIEVYPLKKRLSAMEDPWTITRLGNLNFERVSSVRFNLDESTPKSTTFTSMSEM